MADEILKRDENSVTVLGAVTNNAAQEIRMLRVDPTTGRILADATGAITGSGTSGQVAIWNGTSSITGDADLTFSGTRLTTTDLTIGSMTAGSILFAGVSGAIEQDNSNLFWDNSNNRFAVGTTVPLSPCHIVGKISFGGATSGVGVDQILEGLGTGRIIISRNGTEQWSTNNGGSNDQVFSPGGEVLRLKGSTEALFAGNVAIGTGTTPTVRLDVRRSGAGEIAYFLDSNTHGFITGTSGTTGYLSSSSSATSLAFGINGATDSINIATNKNVGIGTASPGSKLEVNGAIYATGGGISTDYNLYVGGIAEIVTGIWTTSLRPRTNGGNLTFLSNGGTENMRITDGGKVGIRESTPTAYLHLGSGTATASTAPLKFTGGINLTTAEAGAMEFDGTNLYFTRTGTTRENVLIAVDNVAAPSTTATPVFTDYYGGNTNALGDPVRWISVNIQGTDYKIPLYN